MAQGPGLSVSLQIDIKKGSECVHCEAHLNTVTILGITVESRLGQC